MNAPNSRRDLAGFPLTELAMRTLDIAKAVSPMNWVRRWCPLLKPRSEISPEEVCSDDFTKRRGRAVEFYILAWLGIEAAFAALVCATKLPLGIRAFVGLVTGLRIVEIVQVTVNAVVFDRLSGRLDNRVASSARMLVLAFVNFVELCLCFGIVYAMDHARLKGAGRGVTSFYFSVITQLTIGYGDVYPTGYLRLVAAIQGVVSLVFVVLVFAQVVNSLPRVKTQFDSPLGEQDSESTNTGQRA